MMINIKILMISVFCFLLTSMGKAQVKDSLPIVEIKNSELIAIIDSFVDFEKRCDYYNSGLYFSIFFHADSTVQIESFNELTKGKADFGCFTHRGHLFIVSGKIVNRSIFIKTEERKEIEYYQYKDEYDPKADTIIIDAMEDDRFSMWWYKYHMGKFILKGRHTFCE